MNILVSTIEIHEGDEIHAEEIPSAIGENLARGKGFNVIRFNLNDVIRQAQNPVEMATKLRAIALENNCQAILAPMPPEIQSLFAGRLHNARALPCYSVCVVNGKYEILIVGHLGKNTKF